MHFRIKTLIDQRSLIHLKKYLIIALEGIPISIIEPEHVFSVTGSFVIKTRARLGNDSVDSLVFLKNYYNVNKAEKWIVLHI